MKIIFMGTPDFAVPCLKELVKTGHDVVQVITQPDRPKGRGRKLMPPPVKVTAQELGLQVYQPDKIKAPEAVEKIRELAPDAIVVVAFGQLLSRDILAIPRFGCINVHASILPKYRGAAPIHWAVINGEKESGVSIMYMDEGLDTGDVVLVEKTPIAESDTTGILHDKLAFLGARALLRALDLIARGEARRIPQDDSAASYAPLLDKGVELIDWHKTSRQIKDLVRGLNPWPVAYTYFGEKILKIWTVDVAGEETAADGPFRPGRIIKVVPEEGIYVASGDGAVIIKELQLQGSKKMSAEDFIRGRRIEPGTILTNEPAVLS
ncbi:methionyl-tRNA formyltransferase [Thermincola potens]|uniref:Methionyl-tRNA formyltransferase n=1 Tax=Thermincola potens (strain JR) TaxID=635013 RepID=D5X7S5_THEPJ|nr:methionyl-tRNA formyltransferase [Thermincola potens]ADG82645.1 methionyl-tRNA formyltransferase [Thermincola potens JR]